MPLVRTVVIGRLSLGIMGFMLTVMGLFFFRIEIFSTVFLPFAVFPRVAFTGNEGKHTGYC